jgi:hypothetical protein
MGVIYFLICCSIPIALGFLIAFLRSNKAEPKKESNTTE